METCDVLENHEFGRKPIKHLVAIAIAISVRMCVLQSGGVVLDRVGCIQGRREAIKEALH